MSSSFRFAWCDVTVLETVEQSGLDLQILFYICDDTNSTQQKLHQDMDRCSQTLPWFLLGKACSCDSSRTDHRQAFEYRQSTNWAMKHAGRGKTMVSISAEGAHFAYLTVYRTQKSSAGVVSLLVGVLKLHGWSKQCIWQWPVSLRMKLTLIHWWR